MKKVYLIAIVFALIAGFATFMFASDISEKLSYKDANKVTVYVAKQEVPAILIHISRRKRLFRITNSATL